MTSILLNNLKQPVPQRPLRILMIDKLATSRKAHSRILTKAGHDCRTCDNDIHAFQTVKNELIEATYQPDSRGFDIIIINMVDLYNGHEIIQQTRLLGFDRAILVLLNHHQEDMTVACSENGADDVFFSNFSLDLLHKQEPGISSSRSHLKAVEASHNILQKQVDSTKAAPTVSHGDVRILIADASEIIRKALGDVIERTDQIVIEADNVNTTVSMISQSIVAEMYGVAGFHVAVIGYSVLGMDGPHVVKELRKLGYTGIIFGVVAPRSHVTEIETFLAAGCDDVLTRPVLASVFDSKLKDIEEARTKGLEPAVADPTKDQIHPQSDGAQPLLVSKASSSVLDEAARSLHKKKPKPTGPKLLARMESSLVVVPKKSAKIGQAVDGWGDSTFPSRVLKSVNASQNHRSQKGDSSGGKKYARHFVAVVCEVAARRASSPKGARIRPSSAPTRGSVLTVQQKQKVSMVMNRQSLMSMISAHGLVNYSGEGDLNGGVTIMYHQQQQKSFIEPTVSNHPRSSQRPKSGGALPSRLRIYPVLVPKEIDPVKKSLIRARFKKAKSFFLTGS